MEKRTCKLCFKTFCNGRALGGHMRSHMAKLQTPTPPTHLPHKLEIETENETDSASSSSSEDDKGLSYGLRENPKKSFRLVDPEFSSFRPVDAGSVVQDRESETESSRNPSRRRSKRNRKSGLVELPLHLLQLQMNKAKSSKYVSTSTIDQHTVVEPEPVSSVSDTTPEEDVAWCLMMLSRGIRTRNANHQAVNIEDEDEEEEDEDKSSDDDEELEEEIKVRVKKNRGKYQCGTCKKLFRSYQALGGHRASHKKIKGCNTNATTTTTTITDTTPSSSSAAARLYNEEEGNVGSRAALVSTNALPDRRIHECPVCYRVFGSGQALGGHKRSHITGVSSSSALPIRTTNANTNTNTTTRFVDSLIDLNLPAPMEEEEEEEDQIEHSAVSDAEFLHRIN